MSTAISQTVGFTFIEHLRSSRNILPKATPSRGAVHHRRVFMPTRQAIVGREGVYLTRPMR
jgi:hypothetical protein